MNVAIVGLRARKDASAFIGKLKHGIDALIAVPLSEAHIELARVSQLALDAGLEARTAPSLAAAMQIAAQLPAPRVLICGSFVLAAEALAAESV